MGEVKNENIGYVLRRMSLYFKLGWIDSTSNIKKAYVFDTVEDARMKSNILVKQKSIFGKEGFRIFEVDKLNNNKIIREVA